MKKIIPLLLFIVLILEILNLEDLTNYTANLIDPRPSVTIDKMNEYSNDADYYYVKKTKDFVPYSKNDLKDIIYSILDNGYDSFTFYCPSEYTECLNDIEELSNNQITITDIGNFVHPFNNFTSLNIVTYSSGEVNIVVNKSYQEEMIEEINQKIEEIFNQIFDEEMDIHDKILKAHDYIIDHVEYDEFDKYENSGNAYGALIEGYSKCAGYADAMAIVLSKLEVPNFKVASEKHVWNAVYLNDEWTQIDLTWDDPIVQNGASVSDTIRHKFYMIDTKTLLSYDTDEHNFDSSVYIEVEAKETSD